MPGRIFLLRSFVRFTNKARIDTASLVDAIHRADLGIVDADLGGGLLKLRIARQNEGRSGGYRTIVAYRLRDRSFFLYGYAKNNRSNIEPHELLVLREVGERLMSYNPDEILLAITSGEIVECDEE